MHHQTGSLQRARVRIAAAAAISVAAVAGAAAPALAVTGGQPLAAGEHPFVVKLDVGDGTQACSGTLVAPEWVLTATACLSPGGAAVVAGRPAVPVTVLVGRADLTGTTGPVRLATTVAPHPTRGVTLVRLATAVPGIAPLALAAAAPAVDTTVRVAGYGRTATEWIPAAGQSAEVTVSAVTDTAFTVDGPAGTCRGDAGGPAFLTTPDGPRLAGVNGASWQGGCLNESETRRAATEIRVDDLAGWVQQTTEAGQPVGRWDLAEASGTTLADRGVAGPAHPLTASGATPGQAGRVLNGPTAVRFDGTNDSAATSAPVLSTAADYTVSAWVRPITLGTSYTNVVAADGARTSMFGLGKDDANKWVFWAHPADSDTGGGLVEAVATTGPRTGVWTHLAGVFTAANRKLTLYVNGVAAASATMTTAPWNASGGLTVGRGRWKAANGYYFSGDIAEVKAWNRALAAGEFAAHLATPAGRWGLQDDGRDSSGFDRHLTVPAGTGFIDGRYRRALPLSGAEVVSTAKPVLRTDQSFTIGAWVRPSALSTNYTNAVAQDGTRTTMFGLGKDDGNKWVFWVHPADSDTGGGLVEAVAGTGPVVGTWTHLTGVYDAGTQRITLYVNGTAAATVAAPAVWSAGSRLVLGGGRWKAANGYFWSGAVDEVQAYQGALTAADVKILATAPAIG